MDRLHQPFAQALTAVVFMDKDIAQPGERGVIADDARKTNLAGTIIDAKGERVLKITHNGFTRPSLCPIGAPEHVGDGIDIEAGRVRADGEVVAVGFNYLWHGVSVS